jgi:hypothetical protein
LRVSTLDGGGDQTDAGLRVERRVAAHEKPRTERRHGRSLARSRPRAKIIEVLVTVED